MDSKVPAEPAKKNESHLRVVLERDRETAWQIAQYERGQRDQYTSKMRFGLAALNAASMVTILNIGALLNGVEPVALLASAGLFFLGTILAGYSLKAHQDHLFGLEGTAHTRVIALDRALSLEPFPRGSPEREYLKPTMAEADDFEMKTYGESAIALKAQQWSSWAWIIGAAVAGIAKALSFLA